MAIDRTIDYPKPGKVKLTKNHSFAAYGSVTDLSPDDVQCVLRYPNGTTLIGQPVSTPDGGTFWAAGFPSVEGHKNCTLELWYGNEKLASVSDLDLRDQFAAVINYPTSGDTVSPTFVAYGTSDGMVNVGTMTLGTFSQGFSTKTQIGSVWFLCFADIPVGNGYELDVSDDSLGSDRQPRINVAAPSPPPPLLRTPASASAR
jgi:hypothetical protein